MSIRKEAGLGTIAVSAAAGHLIQNQMAKRLLTEKGGAGIVNSLKPGGAIKGIKNGLRNTMVPEAGIIADEVSHGVSHFKDSSRWERAAALKMMSGNGMEKVLKSPRFQDSDKLQALAGKMGMSMEAIGNTNPKVFQDAFNNNGLGQMSKGIAKNLVNINPKTFGQRRGVEKATESIGNATLGVFEPGVAAMNGAKRALASKIQGEGLPARAAKRVQDTLSSKFVKAPVVDNFEKGIERKPRSVLGKFVGDNLVNPISSEASTLSNSLGQGIGK